MNTQKTGRYAHLPEVNYTVKALTDTSLQMYIAPDQFSCLTFPDCPLNKGVLGMSKKDLGLLVAYSVLLVAVTSMWNNPQPNMVMRYLLIFYVAAFLSWLFNAFGRAMVQTWGARGGPYSGTGTTWLYCGPATMLYTFSWCLCPVNYHPLTNCAYTLSLLQWKLVSLLLIYATAAIPGAWFSHHYQDVKEKIKTGYPYTGITPRRRYYPSHSPSSSPSHSTQSRRPPWATGQWREVGDDD